MTVYYRSPFGKSAKRLAEALDMDVQRLRRGRIVTDTGLSDVAWGAPDVRGVLNGGIKVGKLHQLEVWKDASLRTVPFSVTPKEGWLARGVGHYGGNDFLSPVTNAQYFTQPIASRAEYRLHVFRYKGKRGNPANYMVARVGWKTNVEPEKNKVVNDVPIRSRQFGWRLKYYNDNNTLAFVREHPSIDLIARWAIATLRWDFGAIDLIKATNGWPYLLEANSAPGLSDQATLNCYAHRIKAILGR